MRSIAPGVAEPAAASARPERAPLARVGLGSAAYLLANAANKAVGLVLLPLYTYCLTPEEFGAFTVVVVVAGFCAVGFSMGLPAAAFRLYFDLRDRPNELAALWGTLLTALAITCGLGVALLLVVGEALLGPLLGGVPFWPLTALGLGMAAFQPFLDIYLAILQTTERAAGYALVSVGNVLTKTLLAVGLVGWLGLGVEGALAAGVLSGAIFLGVTLLGLRRHVRLGLRLDHLRQALAYCLPLVPHLAAQNARSILDRLLLLHLAGLAAAGVYNVGLQIALLVHVVCFSVHRAFAPVFLGALQDGEAEGVRRALETAGAAVALYGVAAAGASLLAPEALALLSGPAFREAAVVVPLLAPAFAAAGVQAVFVAVLLHARRTRVVAASTVGALAFSAAANAVAIPALGMPGAALATLVTQVLATLGIAWLAHRARPLAWAYRRFASFWSLAAAAGGLAWVEIAPLGLAVAVKATVLVALAASAFAFGLWSWPRGAASGRGEGAS